jgi:hypothetical protein
MNKLVVNLNKPTSVMITLPRAYYNIIWTRYISLIESWEKNFNKVSDEETQTSFLKDLNEAEVIDLMAHHILAISILEDVLGLTKQSRYDLMIETNPCVPL